MSRAPTPEITRKAIQKAFLNGEGTQEQLAARFKVSVPTVRRITQGLNSVRTAVQDLPKEPHVVAGGEEFEMLPSQLIVDAIANLTAKLKGAPVRSLEGGSRALVDLIQAWRDRNPETMEELADLALAIPGFDPKEFARILREKYAQRKTG